MKTFLSFSLLLTITFNFSFTQEKIQNNWKEVNTQLNIAESLTFSSHQLTETSLFKLLSHELPHLISIKFKNNQPLTPILVKTIFTSSYFSKLKILDLGDTNIDDRAFEFLDQQDIFINSSLLYLGLNRLLLGKKGFERLSKISFHGKLRLIEAQGTNLIEPEAVDSFLRIICRYENDTCNSQLVALFIAQTGISRDGFIKLMTSINSTTLEILDISSNLIHTNLKIAQGFNYTAYQILAKIKFPSLNSLFMRKCRLNAKIGQILSKWQTPSLKQLDINSNPLGDQGLQCLITRQRTPKLSKLLLEGTMITDLSMQYIRNQNYIFSLFQFGNNRITSQGLKQLMDMNLTELKELMLKKLDIDQQFVVQVINSINAPLLNKIIIQEMSELKNILNLIKWQKFTKLKEFKIIKTIVADSYEQFINSYTIKSNLTSFSLIDTDINQSKFSLLVLTLPQIFPLLSSVTIRQSRKDIGINLGKLLKAGYKIGCFLYLGSNSIIMNGNKIIVREILSFSLFSFDFFNDQKVVAKNDYSQFALELIKMVQFKVILTIKINQKSELHLLRTIMKEGSYAELKKLTELRIESQINIEDFFGLFSGVQFTHLLRATFKFIVPGDTASSLIDINLFKFFTFFKQIEELFLSVRFLNEESSSVFNHKLLTSLNYSFLSRFQAPSQQLSPSNLQLFIQRHKYGLRYLDLSLNYLEKGFLILIAKNQLILTFLFIGSISFSQKQFEIFGILRTQFLTYLDMQANGLTETHILTLITAKKGNLLFPKLRVLNLENNNIKQIGFEALLLTGMPCLSAVDMQFNKVPAFLNLQLRYSNSIRTIFAENVDVYSLDENIHPDSVLEVLVLNLKTYSFSQTDFKVLGRLRFQNLQESTIYLGNIYSCQSLAELLKINRWANKVVFSFKNDKLGLNSTCLQDISDYNSKLRELWILDEFGTTFLPEFVALMLTTHQNIKTLRLVKTRLSADTLKSIFKHSLNKIQLLDLQYNYLDDQSLKMILANDLSHLQILILKSTLITALSIEELANLSFSNLQFLDLSQNLLGDSIINFLPKIHLSLVELHLSSCGLTKASLSALKMLSFPKLQVLILNFNKFSEQDLISFISDLSRLHLTSLRQISIKGVSLSSQGYEAVRKILENKKISDYKLDRPYNVQTANSATY